MNKTRLSILVLALVLLLSLAACGSGKPAPAPADHIAQTSAPQPDTAPTAEPGAEASTAPTAVPANEEEEEALCLFVEDFARAYFYSTTEEISSYLTEDYAYPVDSYTGDEPREVTFREISPIDGDENCRTTSVQFLAGEEDSYTYLSLELRKTGDSWRVSSYGLEK